MIKRTKHVFIILLLSLVVHGQQQTRIEILDELFSKAYSDFEMAGLAIGIIKDGKIKLAKGYGDLVYGEERKVDGETIFEIASCTKAFTAAAIGMLVDDGLLDWEDRVIDYLPGFKLDDPYVTREIRIIDLLCHRAGFNTFDGDLLWYNTNYTRGDIVDKIKYMSLKNSFRMKYGYSNVMYVVAGEVIEAVTGKTWDDFVQERFFAPLKMTATKTTNRAFTKESNKAQPHLKWEVLEFLNYDNAGPAASINSNINDLMKWVGMWLNKGKLNGEEFLSEKTYQKITSGQIVPKIRESERNLGINFKEYALGWEIFEYNGVKVINHNGGLPGYLSKVAFVPELNLGFVILYNNMSYVLNAAMYSILDAYIKDEIGNHFETTKEAVDKYHELEKVNLEKRANSQIKNTAPSLSLEGYSGTYNDKMYGDATVTFSNGQLTLSLLPAKKYFTADLIHWHFDTFDFKFNDSFLPNGLITFEFGSTGEVTGFKIDLPNPDFHFYNLHFVKREYK